jgi:hypothetical protein
MFKEMAGNWTYVMKMRQAPDGPVMESKGTVVAEVALNGFFIFSKMEGEMMGMKFEGRDQLGYDPNKKKYVGTWAVNMGPYLMTYEGTWDPAKKALTTKGEMFDQMQQKNVTVKMVTEVKDADHHTFRMFMPGPDGKDAEAFSVEYTRKK